MLCVSRAVCICVSAQIASFFVILFEETPGILFLESCIGVEILPTTQRCHDGIRVEGAETGGFISDVSATLK